MKISKGPMLEKYSRMTDVPIGEVMEWINLYVNQPELFDFQTEETEQERFTSIKLYVLYMLDNSTTQRIKNNVAKG